MNTKNSDKAIVSTGISHGMSLCIQKDTSSSRLRFDIANERNRKWLLSVSYGLSWDLDQVDIRIAGSASQLSAQQFREIVGFLNAFMEDIDTATVP
jgi:hypothetical protein